ncbi:DUF397 domain-containing protein [Streptomyces marincola]|uniref:DUF397 domain-containing protein n=1 Tax=Streptomyces marincola TaxID=2878388 RepID=A0A1W7CZS9_9ACTN|nr:DUF397 domain-containing protein [Streptomyces marincola]ARQ70245.1 DUF397 domain-containing protein [Streptomyces marincola]
MTAQYTEPDTKWVSSSHSINGGQCVQWAPEVVVGGGSVPVRDSKVPAGPVLAFPAAAWQTFVATLDDRRA